MINLGRTRRWAGRVGAVERAAEALKKRRRASVCPNCGKSAPGGLFAYEVQQEDALRDSYTVTHCGCFHEGTAEGKKHHHTTEPMLPISESKP